MAYMLKPIERLIREFNKLPGIGTKSAMRLAFHTVEMQEENVHDLAEAIKQVKNSIKVCSTCFGFSVVKNTCELCEDPARDHSVVCVVEKPQDVFIMERSGFRGTYHVLHGLIAPLDGVGPSDIKIYELIARLKKNKEVTELVIALNSSVEGDATTLFIAQSLKDNNIHVSRLARGVPAGASIDYVDDKTLTKAIEERQRVCS